MYIVLIKFNILLYSEIKIEILICFLTPQQIILDIPMSRHRTLKIIGQNYGFQGNLWNVISQEIIFQNFMLSMILLEESYKWKDCPIHRGEVEMTNKHLKRKLNHVRNEGTAK